MGAVHPKVLCVKRNDTQIAAYREILYGEKDNIHANTYTVKFDYWNVEPVSWIWGFSLFAI